MKCPLFGKIGDIHCAKKLGKGECDVRNITETFRRNSTGNQSRLVEPGEQPEASLAWGGVSRTAKRRQRVPMPCDRAPKLPFVESPRRTMCVGPCRAAVLAWQRRSRRGPRAGRRHKRVPQELGTPCRFHLYSNWFLGEGPDPKLPGPKSASDLAGGTKTGARGGNRPAKETKRDGKGGRESEHFIVPRNRENVTLRIPRREGSAGSRDCWRETWRVHRNPIPCPRNNNR